MAAHRDRPESHGEARAHDRYTNQAHGLGLCMRCAAQIGFARQLGYSRVRPPCTMCDAIVAVWSTPDASNGWKRWPGGAPPRARITRSPRPPFGCGGCESRWGGLKTVHCPRKGCHRTFTSIRVCERHEKGSHKEGRYCVDPASVGLVLNRNGYWTLGRDAPKVKAH